MNSINSYRAAIRPALLSALVLSVLSVTSCGGGADDATSSRLAAAGFSEEVARELSTMKLTEQEIAALEESRKAGLDGTAALEMVRSLRERDLRYDIGTEMRLLMADSLSSTAATQLVELGAIPRWEADIRALKQAGVGDVAVIELAKMRFEENKEILSGGEYANLKKRRMSDAGLLTFARKGGTAQQLQQVTLAMDLGKSEQEALREVGM